MFIVCHQNAEQNHKSFGKVAKFKYLDTTLAQEIASTKKLKKD